MKKSGYDEFLRSRLNMLFESSGLSVADLEREIGVSGSHFYNMLNGRREVLIRVVGAMGDLFGLSVENICDPGYILPGNLKITKAFPDLRDRASRYISNSRTRFILDELYATELFDRDVTVLMVRKECHEKGRKYTSKQVARALEYLAEAGFLLSKKSEMIKRDGTKGHRTVHFYRRNPKMRNKRLRSY